MAAREMTRRQKAITFVPIALLSGAWTVSMLGFGSADAAGGPGHGGKLPDGTSVPTKAIQAPANVPVAGQIAPGVPDGDADSVAAGASTSGIPSSALSAYQRAAQIIDAADTTCHLPWELVAAIGRVESDHGRFAGNILGSDGVSSPGIYGPVLNGQDGTTAIKDTDGGELDKDATWDRAVGAMQFIPSTWQVVKVDADGDGQRNPQDIDDASLATSVYLCSGSEDLGKEAGQKSAVFRYNHSEQYVDLVLRIMQAYQAGDYTAVPDGASGGQVLGLADTTQAGGGSSPKAAIKKPRAAASSAAPAAPASSAAPASGGGNGGSSNANNAPSTPKTSTPANVPAPKPPSVPSPGQVISSAAAPVVHLLTGGEASDFCAGKLPAAVKVGVPNALATCAGQIAGKTQDQANAAIGGIIASLTSLLPKLPLG